MPCKSEHCEPNAVEVERSKVLALLEELTTGTLPDYYGDGHYHKVHNNGYNNASNKEFLDKQTEELCEKLQIVDWHNVPSTKYSPQMQMWWQAHQAADKARLENELAENKKKEDTESALQKLSPYERGLLGH